jgi:hypothetical protein
MRPGRNAPRAHRSYQTSVEPLEGLLEGMARGVNAETVQALGREGATPQVLEPLS